ncbi:hypothetical protein Tco_1528669, partial [Tanacetum coccineum]
MKGAPECMQIFGFMHGVNNPELTKHLNEHVPKTVEEMMTPTIAFIRGETVAASKKKVHTPWKIVQTTTAHGNPDRKKSNNKFCEFHNDKGHNTDECVQLRKQIEELVRADKLSHFIKEIKQDRDQQKTRKKDALVKDKSVAIYMIQLWQRVTRQKVTQSFARVKAITFPPLTANKGTDGPLVIEAEIGGHAVHRIYVDGGSSMETVMALGNYRRPRAFSKSMDNFMIMRSPSPYNVTISSTILTLTECATIEATPKDSAKKAKSCHENFKVAIHPDFPDLEITIEGA